MRTILSLGAGVQSSTIALMATKGEITPMPDAAIFADTQAEPANVYKWLDWLEKQLAFPVYRVTTGNLAEDSLRIRTSKLSGKRYMKGAIPAFILKPDGGKGLLGRQCTADYKRGEKRHLVDLWIGISANEAIRMKPSREKWIQHQWPLIDRKMTRKDCLSWMQKNGFPEPPRSACVFCPFHSDEEWRRLRDTDNTEFLYAADYEKRLQNAARNQEVLTGMPYLHSSCVPLEQVAFKEEKGYQQLSLFGNECEGLCGV
jgi:hypothetical protein